MVSSSRLISKRVTKALHFGKVLEIEGFEVYKKWALGYKSIWFLGIPVGFSGYRELKINRYNVAVYVLRECG